MSKQKFKFWKVSVTKHLNEVLEKAVTLNTHVSKSEFIRCAVREKLANMGLKEELETIQRDLHHRCDLQRKETC